MLALHAVELTTPAPRPPKHALFLSAFGTLAKVGEVFSTYHPRSSDELQNLKQTFD